jgi:Na+-transporting NADH:ubiquinone oxidoreductase subunit NqrB
MTLPILALIGKFEKHHSLLGAFSDSSFTVLLQKYIVPPAAKIVQNAFDVKLLMFMIVHAVNPAEVGGFF